MTSRSPLIAGIVSWALRRHLRRSFAGLYVSGDLPEPCPGQGMIVFSNHPSWWDPAVFAVLQHTLFHPRAAYGPIDAAALQAYPLFEKAGFIPVDPDRPATLKTFLLQARKALQQGNVVWITAEGHFRDPRSRPIVMKTGVAHLVRQTHDVLLVPLALEYAFGEEQRAEIFLRFGNPIQMPDHSPDPMDVATIQRICEHSLTSTMDQLAASVSERSKDDFRQLMKGRYGIGGFYDGLRTVRSWMKGKRFVPSHAALTSRPHKKEPYDITAS